MFSDCFCSCAPLPVEEVPRFGGGSGCISGVDWHQRQVGGSCERQDDESRCNLMEKQQERHLNIQPQPMLSGAVIEKDKSSDSIANPGQLRECVTWEDRGLLGSAPLPCKMVG
jgi:hypothetical protein